MDPSGQRGSGVPPCVEIGVVFPRHTQGETNYLGLSVREVAAGFQVVAVRPATYADRVGMKPGDLLVELAGAGIYRQSQLAFFTREHRSSAGIEAAWVRRGKLMRGSATLENGASPA